MAIVWWEDFEALQTSTLGWRADTLAGAGVLTVTTGTLNGRHLQISTAGSTPIALAFSLPSTYSQGLLSLAGFYASGSFTQSNILQIMSGSVVNIAIRLNTNGSITAMRGTTALGDPSAPGVVPSGKRFRMEVGFVISNDSGEVVVKIDQGSGPVTVLNLTLQDTDNGSSTINRFTLNTQSTGGSIVYWDDIWFDDDKTAFRSDHVFKKLYLTSDVSAVSTQSSGVNRFATIDEFPASTGDYNIFSVTGEDIFNFIDLDTTPALIAGVGVYYIANKSDAGTMSFRSRILSNTDYANGSGTGLNASILGYSDFYPTDPQGGGSWTKTRVDDSKIVLERIS